MQPKKKRAAPSTEETPKASTSPAKGRPTFSLFGLGGGGGDSAAEQAPTKEFAATPEQTTARVASKAMATAPRDVPTLSGWTVDLRNNFVSGVITGAGGAFSKG